MILLVCPLDKASCDDLWWVGPVGLWKTEAVWLPDDPAQSRRVLDGHTHLK